MAWKSPHHEPETLAVVFPGEVLARLPVAIRRYAYRQSADEQRYLEDAARKFAALNPVPGMIYTVTARVASWEWFVCRHALHIDPDAALCITTALSKREDENIRESRESERREEREALRQAAEELRKREAAGVPVP